MERYLDKKQIARFAAGAMLYLMGIIAEFSHWAEFSIFFMSYILIGGEVVLRAIKNIMRGQVFDENFLMSAATMGAFAIKEFPEGVAVMLFYQIGEFLQDMAVNRSRRSIKSLMNIRPDYANLKIDGEIRRVSPEDVKPADIIIVKPGERIPLDGRITSGKSIVDMSALTGESVPREVEEGNSVFAGFINMNGILEIEVTRNFAQSSVARILDLVQSATERKTPTEKFITSFARYYTPVVVITALLLSVVPPLVLPGEEFSRWLYRSLIFLVVSCPCALVISIPLGFFGGIGGASKNGILVKGSSFLEALDKVDTFVFDKTGTLTKGVFKVTDVSACIGFTRDELLEYAAYAESCSNHPIASSILSLYNKEIYKNEIKSYNEIPGHGIKAEIRNRVILAGNARLMRMEGIPFEEVDALGTVVHIAVDGNYAGFIVISDEVKEDSAATIKSLRKIGAEKLVMLTGDSKAAGMKVGKLLGFDEVYAELLPEQKVEKLEQLYKQKLVKSKIAFVGDGINDAPVLARADVGIAMGGLGSDAAIEAADIVIMTDEPLKLVSAIMIARRTRVVIWQNIIFALSIKAMILLLGALGYATMWLAVFADVGVALLAVLNSMRAMKAKNAIYE